MSRKLPPKINKSLYPKFKGAYSWDNGSQAFDKKEKGFPKKNEK